MGLVEKNLNLQIVQKIVKYLVESNFKVYITKEIQIFIQKTLRGKYC